MQCRVFFLFQVWWTALSVALGLNVRGDVIKGVPCVKRYHQLFCPTAGNSYPMWVEFKSARARSAWFFIKSCSAAIYSTSQCFRSKKILVKLTFVFCGILSLFVTRSTSFVVFITESFKLKLLIQYNWTERNRGSWIKILQCHWNQIQSSDSFSLKTFCATDKKLHYLNRDNNWHKTSKPFSFNFCSLFSVALSSSLWSGLFNATRTKGER